MSLFTQLIPSFSRPALFRRQTETPLESREPGIRPVYHVTETEDAWGLTVHLPGVAKDGVSITESDGVLTIRGERTWKRPAGWTELYRESIDAPFELTFDHDHAVDVDKIVAELTDGILRVSLPKAEARKPRRIAVK